MHFTNHVYLNSSAVALLSAGKLWRTGPINYSGKKKKNPRLCEASSLPEGGSGRRCPPSSHPASLPLLRPFQTTLGWTLNFWVLGSRGTCAWSLGVGCSHFCGQGGKVVGTRLRSALLSFHPSGQWSVLCRHSANLSRLRLILNFVKTLVLPWWLGTIG